MKFALIRGCTYCSFYPSMCTILILGTFQPPLTFQAACLFEWRFLQLAAAKIATRKKIYMQSILLGYIFVFLVG